MDSAAPNVSYYESLAIYRRDFIVADTQHICACCGECDRDGWWLQSFDPDRVKKNRYTIMWRYFCDECCASADDVAKKYAALRCEEELLKG